MNDCQIRITPDGFHAVEDGKLTFGVRWTAVEEVFAYKRDCLTVDCIYLGFRRTDGQSIEVPEEDPNYSELVKAMEIAFPDHKADWWAGVAFPAFATNYTTIWKQPGASASEITP
jgi:hypothetical protein